MPGAVFVPDIPQDGPAGTASSRTLGTGAQQAAAGNHTHTQADVASLISDLAARALSTDGRFPTANEKAALAGTSGTAVSVSNKFVDNADMRLTDARTPTTHTHAFSALTGTVSTAQIASTSVTASKLDPTTIGVFNVRAYGAVGDGITDDTTAVQSAITAAAGKILDLAGGTYLISSPLTMSAGKTTIRNGSIVGGTHNTFRVNAADTTFVNLKITRDIGAGSATTLADRSSVSVNAARFRSIDCDYTGANHALVYLSHGNCNGSVIRGGQWSNSSARQNSCAVYSAAGVGNTKDIRVEGITVDNTAGSPDGILFYDCSYCALTGNTIRNLTALPEVTLTGWTLVSGNVYKTAERTDGGTRVILWNGVEMTEETVTPATPPSNTWGINGGFVYINLAGTDPNSGTVKSNIVSGYGLLFYSTTNNVTPMCDNIVENNVVQNTDGFGIYLQLDQPGALRNGTLNNRLSNVCLKGVQSNKLPFAGIGIIGGNQTTCIGDSIDTVGTVTYPAPGFRINPPNSTLTCTGTVQGMTVMRATKDGIAANNGSWVFTGCRSSFNTGSGFVVTRWSNAQVVDAVFQGCEARSNTNSGVGVDNTGFPGAQYRISVIGGTYRDNTNRGIILRGCIDSKVVGATCGANGSGFAQIQLDGSSVRVLVESNVITSGSTGIYVDVTCSDITVGSNQISSVVTTPLNLNIPVHSGGSSTVSQWVGSGSPETVVTASPGSVYRRTNGGAGTTFYVKESGTGNTGWTAISIATGPTVTALKTTAYTAAANEVVRCNTSAAGFIVSLPGTHTAGQQVIVKDVNGASGTAGKYITVNSADGDLIDGLTTHIIMSAYAAVTFISDGTNWMAI